MSDIDLKHLENLLADPLLFPVNDPTAIAPEADSALETDRTERITVRLQPGEKNWLLLDARGLPLSKYIRSRLFGYEKPSPPILAPAINRDLYVELLRLHQLIERQLREAQAREQQELDSNWSDLALTLTEIKRFIIELRKEVVTLSTKTVGSAPDDY